MNNSKKNKIKSDVFCSIDEAFVKLVISIENGSFEDVNDCLLINPTNTSPESSYVGHSSFSS